MPLHSRMRASDRDLIREGHYGQRSCEPRKQAEHMAAPTNSANVKISLANSEPSTHGTKRTWRSRSEMSAFAGIAAKRSQCATFYNIISMLRECASRNFRSGNGREARRCVLMSAV